MQIGAPLDIAALNIARAAQKLPLLAAADAMRYAAKVGEAVREPLESRYRARYVTEVWSVSLPHREPPTPNP